MAKYTLGAISASDDSRDFTPEDMAKMSLAHKHAAAEGTALGVAMRVRSFTNDTTKKEVISLTADSVLAIHTAVAAALE